MDLPCVLTEQEGMVEQQTNGCELLDKAKHYASRAEKSISSEVSVYFPMVNTATALALIDIAQTLHDIFDILEHLQNRE